MSFDYRKEYRRYKKRLAKKVKEIYKAPEVKTSVGLIFIFITIALFALKPTVKTVSGLIKELQEKNQINKTLEKKVAALEQAKLVYAQAEPFLPLVDRALPKKPAVDLLNSQVNFLAFSNQTVLVSAVFSDFELASSLASESQAGQNFDFKITVAGSFENISNFLRGLENISRVVKINSVKIYKEPEEKISGLKMEVKGRGFWLENQTTKKEEAVQ